mmetsp:Transcript_30363/g.55014  ORF Transcript_30363/g.55014 Transcript_30363/m.55014 type:complete len:92 (+) Transcript_30363:144-419(+)
MAVPLVPIIQQEEAVAVTIAVVAPRVEDAAGVVAEEEAAVMGVVAAVDEAEELADSSFLPERRFSLGNLSSATKLVLVLALLVLVEHHMSI